MSNNLLGFGRMNRDGFQYGLSVAGLLWYLVMWALSLLGCVIAYASPAGPSGWTQKIILVAVGTVIPHLIPLWQIMLLA